MTPDERLLVKNLVVTEYLLPMIRRDSADALVSVTDKVDPEISYSLAEAFQQVKTFSDLLLESQGYPTSFWIPLTMNRAERERPSVKALVDGGGACLVRSRRADPKTGVPIFN